MITYKEFLLGVPYELKNEVDVFHKRLVGLGLKIEIKPASNGFVASYIQNKKTIFNYVFRKSGMIVRLYAENLYGYTQELQSLPQDLVEKLKNATKCRECNVRCPKGYSLVLNDGSYYICRYSFMLPITADNFCYVQTIIEKEIQLRG